MFYSARFSLCLPRRGIVAVVLACILSCLCGLDAQDFGDIPDPFLVSQNAGDAANQPSQDPSVSADGNIVVYASMATNLAADDSDRVLDIYRYAVGGTTSRLLTRGTDEGDKADSHSPSVNEDGSRVVFVSEDSNFDPRDTGEVADIYLFDSGTGRTTLVSVSIDGGSGNRGSSLPVISDDGSVIVYLSAAGNLASPGVAAGTQRIHIHDISSGDTTRLDASGTAGVSDVSADGSIVVFGSTSGTFVQDDTNGFSDIFVLDRDTDQISRVSVGAGGLQADAPSTNPRLSADGRYAAFESGASNLVAGDTNDVSDVFVHDRVTGTTERVSLSDAEAQLGLPSTLGDINGTGRFVAFVTAEGILPADVNQFADVYRRDRTLGETFFLGAGETPQDLADGASSDPSMSEDGQGIAFRSAAGNLSSEDDNQFEDIFLSTFTAAAPSGPFPVSDHILFPGGDRLRQLTPDGVQTANDVAISDGGLQGLAIDEENVAWVVTKNRLDRYEAATLAALDSSGTDLPLEIAGATFHGVVVGQGFGFVAVDDRIVRVTPTGASTSVSMDPIPPTVALAFDPFGTLWVAHWLAGVQTFTRYSVDLEVLNETRLTQGDAVEGIAFDTDGNVYLGTSTALEKRTYLLAPLWSKPVAGERLVVDADGNAYTFSATQVLGFRSGDGERFFASTHGGLSATGNHLTIDGRGNLWLFRAGETIALRWEPRAADGLQTASPFTISMANPQTPGDNTGFVMAHIVAPQKDADGDEILNRVETEGGTNPFDPSDPDPLKILPPVLNLTARGQGARDVRLDWTSAATYDRVTVLRDGREVDGSPFSFAEAAGGITDADVPGGPRRYRVIGQAPVGGGAGGGGAGVAGDDGTGIFAEVVFSLGEGAVLGEIGLAAAPVAVTYQADGGQILVALEDNTLLRLSEALVPISSEPLPAVLAGQGIRGMVTDPGNPDRTLFLTADGSLYGVTVAGTALLLNLTPASEAGFHGLGANDDRLLSWAGPDLDCLIGYVADDGAGSLEDVNFSAATGMAVQHSIGVATLGEDVLLGIGPAGAGDSTITRVVRLPLEGDFTLGDVSATVPLDAVNSSEITDFDFAPGLGLLVTDRQGQRLVVLEATFAGSIGIVSVTPPSGKWDTPTQVTIVGSGLQNDPGDLWVSVDGVDTEVELFSLGGAVESIRLTLPPSDRAEVVSIEVLGSQGPGGLFPGFAYGFRRGDSDNDDEIVLADAVFALNFLFLGREAPPCRDAADVDDSGELGLDDAVRLLNFLFLGREEPASPFSSYGVDGSEDPLPCGAE